MNEQPKRKPDISMPIDLPTEETLQRLHRFSADHPDEAVRLLAAVVARLAPAVETIGRALPHVARGDVVSLDEHVE